MLDLVGQRICTQLTPTASVRATVQRLGAVQAQDYLGALWAIGLRTKDATEAAVERALAEKEIVRTWPLRGTLHFVAAEDARWMLDVAAPATLHKAKKRHRDLGIDEPTVKRSRTIFEKLLAKEGSVGRRAMYAALERGAVSTEGQRGIHILFRLAHDGVLCFGAREGKEQTFALLDDWLPKTRKKTRDEGLHDLALRYFEGHGPATAKDFGWWSGLVAADAKAALASVGSELETETIGRETFHFARSRSHPMAKAVARVHLLPPFDEYVVAYKDRTVLVEHAKELLANALNGGGGMLAAVVVVDGLVVGTWKRTLGKTRVTVVSNILTAKVKMTKSELEAAANTYGRFLGLEAELQLEGVRPGSRCP